MKAEELLEKIGEVDERFAAEAAAKPKKTGRRFGKLAAAAAAFALLLTAGFLLLPGGKTEAKDLLRDVTPQKPEEGVITEDFKTAYWDWTCRLMNALDTDRNSLISPYSLMTVTDMVGLGASGSTRAEIEAVLGASPEEICRQLYCLRGLLAKTALVQADGLWFDECAGLVKTEYLARVLGAFQANAYQTNFQANREGSLKAVNEYVNRATKGMIPEGYKSLDPNTILLLTDALLYEGQWEEKFDKDKTGRALFTELSGEQVYVEMMNGSADSYLEDETAIGVVKPYRDGISFVALMPKKGEDYRTFAAELSAGRLAELTAARRPAEVTLKLPKLSMSYSADARRLLEKAGLQLTLSLQAEFSGITDDDVYLSDICHKTRIEMDEEGARVAAFSGIGVAIKSAPMPIKLTFDRPFVFFFVEDTTGLPLFVGTVTDFD